MEPTLDAYVERLVRVFREVRRVLRDDGTLWLNLGDSYATSTMSGPQGANGDRATRTFTANLPARQPAGCKPKDLIGVPWAVAFALRQPFYTGRIKREVDRAWLAAMIDGEGSLFIQKRNAGSESEPGSIRKSDTFSPGLSVSNTDPLIVERCREITGVGSIMHRESRREGHRVVHDWRIMANQAREIIREVYPYLVAKRQQARILISSPSSGPDAAACHEALKLLHHCTTASVDFREPKPSDLWEPGWYLRSDVVWFKQPCMPESIEDRPTRAHEFIFLLSKSARYFYDADAIREPLAREYDGEDDIGPKAVAKLATADSQENGARTRPRPGSRDKQGALGKATYTGFNARWDANPSLKGANKRDVWRIAPAQYAEAHFATFPPEIPSLCIRAGSKPGDLVPTRSLAQAQR